MSRETDSQFFFHFTAVNPMYVNQDLEEVPNDLDKPRRIAVYNNIWRVHQNIVYWCNLKLAQRKGLQVYQNPIARQSLFSTHYLLFGL